MKIIKIIILFISLLIPFNNAYSQSSQVAQYRKGIELMERKFYNEAIEIFEDLVKEGVFVKDCEGRIKEARKAISYITITANDKTISENLCEIFLKAKPINEPIIVAPPTPKAVKRTNFILIHLPIY